MGILEFFFASPSGEASWGEAFPNSSWESLPPEGGAALSRPSHHGSRKRHSKNPSSESSDEQYIDTTRLQRYSQHIHIVLGQ